ncbi:hypothetical protein [Zhongshania sp.]|jgi:hypothetical protein|uniref:hypothetical protein n=1 Tax=Zhongshania sp. TaxID=1971902 RepID=UPI002A80B79C|nr:hypothetical protein [Zhongshania sp.]
MTRKSNHSQDYDRKHGSDYDVKDKATRKEDFIYNKRRDADRKDKERLFHAQYDDDK